MNNEIRGPYGGVWPRESVLRCVGPGWSGIVSRLIDDLFTLGWDGSLHQAKEKFGELRFYVARASDAIFERIDKATEESRRTCETCGKPGRTDNWGHYWTLTLCPEHGEERRQDRGGVLLKPAAGKEKP